MAAVTAVAPLRTEWIDIWTRFASGCEESVRESNILAGRTLWEIESMPAAARLVVRSTRTPAWRYVECSFSFVSGNLTCSAGPAIRTGALVFEACNSPGPALRLDGSIYSPKTAVNMVLDELVATSDEDR